MPERQPTDPRRAMNMGVGVLSPLWPTFLALAGTGVAFWWWSQWARGKAETSVLSSLPAPLKASIPPRPAITQGEPAAVEVAPPELVMAHTPPPPEAPDAVTHPTDQALPAPAAEIMAHTPPETVGVSFKTGTGFEHRDEETPSTFPAVAKPAEAAETQPVDAEAMATETSAAALTDGEVVDEIVSPEATAGITGSLGVQGATVAEGAPAPAKRRKKPPAKAPDAG